MAIQLGQLGASAFYEYQRTGHPDELNAAVTAFRDAVAVTPPRDRACAGRLSNLGLSLTTRFELTRNAADLDEAINTGRDAVAATPRHDPNLAVYLSNLGMSLQIRFELSRDPADLVTAIDTGRKAVEVTPPGHPYQAKHLANLGAALMTRFIRQAKDAADLNEAIDTGRKAVDLTPPDNPDFAGMLSNLGASLHLRYELAGDAADLNTAITECQRAADLTPSGHPTLARNLANLGAALRSRFELAGDAADLDAAIDAERNAVHVAPPGHPDLTGMLSNLGISLTTRFGLAGDAADLDAAIDAERKAVALTPPGHPDLARNLANLAAALTARFSLAADPTGLKAADSDAAIDAARKAVALTPPGHPDLPGRLSNLGNSLFARFGLAGNATDLDAAINAGEKAVRLTPPGHTDLASHLSNLGSSLLMRFKLAKDATDLDAAIDAGQETARLTQPGHPDLAKRLSNLGSSLHARFELNGDTADLDAAIERWRRSSEVPTGIPSVRLAAARMWGAMAADAGRTRDAADGHAVALGLLQTVAWHGLDRATREDHLREWAGLAADGAACAVLDARPGLAVELLEQGRSVLWTQALNLRGDLTRLATEHPALAARLDGIRKILDAPMPGDAPFPPEPAGTSAAAAGRARQHEKAADLRKRKAREWDECLAQVRALPGFEHFLAAIPYPQLTAAAADGPTVIVNASRFGCHALIVDADSAQPRVVSLPAMTVAAATDQASRMLTALASAADPVQALLNPENATRAVLDVLVWLWDVIAEPVLTALGHISAYEAGSPWPRVWWCPIGPLAVLPIHAAGHYPRPGEAADDSSCSVPDRVISSYTPTLAALIRARQPAQAAPIRQLTVGIPAAPGQPPLPAVPAELKVLADCFPAGTDNHQLTGAEASHASVLAAIADHSWIHLACHASQRHADPASSGFALWDGMLTITDLAAQPTQRRDLAFLSACQTAAGSVRHLDEAIHLAAAMQFLGYRQVIATMWTIADLPAPRVASAFYAALRPAAQPGSDPDPSRKPDPGRAAEALHHAIGALRQEYPASPLLWAPYIHLGG